MFVPPNLVDIIIWNLPSIIVLLVITVFVYLIIKENLFFTTEKYDQKIDLLNQQNESALKQVETLKQQNQEILKELESLKKPKGKKEDDWFLD